MNKNKKSKCATNNAWTSGKFARLAAHSPTLILISHTYSGDPNSPLNTKLKVWQSEAADLDPARCTTRCSNGRVCGGMILTGIVNINLSVYAYWEGVEVNQFQAAYCTSGLDVMDTPQWYKSTRLLPNIRLCVSVGRRMSKGN
ncbi:hypothetical protein BJ165DRAFT_1399473 [Panaeolus papilionaceus]|nr:hypothetical protein BJ165DRAFT_1399473 [Panaeolus papilionaceus]